MTPEQLQVWYQSQAPCYYRLPDDGADYKCSECKELTPHYRMIKTFCPDGKPRFAICTDCADEDWLKNAKELPYRES